MIEKEKGNGTFMTLTHIQNELNSHWTDKLNEYNQMKTHYYNDGFAKAKLNAHKWIQSLEAEILQLESGPMVQMPIVA
jgi:hypothetical protein